MQTIESEDHFWRILSEQPIEDLDASPEDRGRLAKCFYFHPNPAVKRVVSIGTPHRGSDFASDYVRQASRLLITLPEMMLELGNKLTLMNPGYFRNTELLTTTTSIDSLAPDCPIFPAMREAPRAPGVQYHNIVGVVPKKSFLGRVSEEGDGVVALSSAHLEHAASEIVVEADHLTVHQHPLTILEVRRILLEHVQSIGERNVLPRPLAAAPLPQPIAH
jgi:hypothetical protein